MKINNYLKKEILLALPNSHRTLITSVIRKLLASSSMAVAETFRALKNRLVILKETTREESVEESLDFFFSFFDDDEVEDEPENDHIDQLYTREKVNEFIQHEIDEIDDIINTAEKIKKNAKITALKIAVRKAFDFQRDAEIKEKVVIFTESVRTQQYIFEELSDEGYQGQILKFNGSSGDDTTKELFRAWRNRNYGKYFGSRNVELKNAIVQAFKENFKIFLVTDSGSEGLNLQFCNTIINYDLPWNPQKIEQRIGRCHRYGQKNDVVVFNLLNTQNVADKRVYEILSNKFELFKGVFGASDRAIGLLESGADFEKRVSHIYQECKTSKDFTKEFTSLERELDRKRNKKMEQLKSLIIREAPEQHKETFEKILSDIQAYQEQLDYWEKAELSHKQVIYPLFYELKNGLNIPGIEHGYLLIGGYYAGEELIQSVFQISDEKGKIYAAKDELIRILTSSLTDDNLIEESPDNVAGIIKDVDEYLFQEHADKCKILISQNDERIENWTNLRKEEFILSIKDSYTLEDEETQEYIKKRFTHTDENGRKFRLSPIISPTYSSTLVYEYKGYKPPKNGWSLSLSKMQAFEAEGRLYMPENKEQRIQRKQYLDEYKGRPIGNLWTDINVINPMSTERLEFVGQKPEVLIERILLLSTQEGDLVLDSFLGSGTTMAVAHKMKRKWIGIELGDQCFSHDIPRIKKVVDGNDDGGITKKVGWTGGGGYKFYELAEPLLVKNSILPIYQINPSYTWDMVCEAICKIEGYYHCEYGIHRCCDV